MKSYVPLRTDSAIVPKAFVEKLKNVAEQEQQKAHEKEIADRVTAEIDALQAKVNDINETSLPHIAWLFSERFFRLDNHVFFDAKQGLVFPDPYHFFYDLAQEDRTSVNDTARARLQRRNQAMMEGLTTFEKWKGRLPSPEEARELLQNATFLRDQLKKHNAGWEWHPLEHLMDQKTFTKKIWRFATATATTARRRFADTILVLPVCDVGKEASASRKDKLSLSGLYDRLKYFLSQGIRTISTIDNIKAIECGTAIAAIDGIRRSLPDTYVTLSNWRLRFDVARFRKDKMAEYHTSSHAKEVANASFDIERLLLDCDKLRADMASYPASILTDTNQGHWELAESLPDRAVTEDSPFERIQLPRPLVARPPQMDVHESGTCAIDFGTKSTVVACRDCGERLLRIGKGNFDAAPQASDYENPTVMEFRDIAGFRTAYAARDGRPFTAWEQMTVSHHARNQLLHAEHADGRAAFFSELKQWANSDSAVRHIEDRNGVDLVLPAYRTLADGAFDPIELYAYDLGLCINNMMNGIYLDYVLSYPVKYPKDVCERIRRSFERGLKKSLPPILLEDEEAMEAFRVYLGASEPAAYASCALQALSETYPALEPGEDAPVAYAVFDFGGGTTDFDYGIWRLPTPEDKGRWNYVLEDFAAGSDVHLGGEKLLDQLAYRVYQDNLPALRAHHIPIALPAGAQPFAGGERLINGSDAAYMNLKQLGELVRPVWEQPESEACTKLGKEPQAMLLFTDVSASEETDAQDKATGALVNVKLDIHLDTLQSYLRARIQRGIENFFTGLGQAFAGREVGEIHILLAGNSCRSSLVQALFQEAMEAAPTKEKLVLYPPLHSAPGDGETDAAEAPETEAAPSYDRLPTGKTGVAFGLLDCRRGGHDVKVIDHNRTEDREAAFPYVLGESGRKNRFLVRVDQTVGYGTWAPFLPLDEEDDAFELYYTTEARALGNTLSIDELPAPARCRVHYLGDARGGCVWLRKVAPHVIEYTVTATENDMPEDGTTLAKIESCTLEVGHHG